MANRAIRVQHVAFVAAACAVVPLAAAGWLQRWTEVAAWGGFAAILLVMATMDRGADRLDREWMAGVLRRARILGAVDPTITMVLRLDGGLLLRVAFTVRQGAQAHAYASEWSAWPGDGAELASRIERAIEDGLLGTRNELYERG
jgi:hypothetical protein